MTIATPTVEEVRAIIETAATDLQVAAAITDAALLVEGTCVEGYSEDRQKVIVKYIAAHLLSVATSLTSGGSGALTSQRLGDASESYASSPLGEGLFSTMYGKQAILFDTNGCLASLGKVPIVFEVL